MSRRAEVQNDLAEDLFNGGAADTIRAVGGLAWWSCQQRGQALRHALSFGNPLSGTWIAGQATCCPSDGAQTTTGWKLAISHFEFNALLFNEILISMWERQDGHPVLLAALCGLLHQPARGQITTTARNALAAKGLPDRLILQPALLRT